MRFFFRLLPRSYACFFFWMPVPQHFYCHYWGGSAIDGDNGDVVIVITVVVVVVVESQERIFSVWMISNNAGMFTVYYAALYVGCELYLGQQQQHQRQLHHYHHCNHFTDLNKWAGFIALTMVAIALLRIHTFSVIIIFLSILLLLLFCFHLSAIKQKEKCILILK